MSLKLPWIVFMDNSIITNTSKSKMNMFNKNVIIKPLYGNGGEGVFYVKDNDSNFNVILENFLSLYEEQFIIQSYIPEVKQGDKRIILIDGDAVGAINRIPARNEWCSNMHCEGRPTKP